MVDLPGHIEDVLKRKRDSIIKELKQSKIAIDKAMKALNALKASKQWTAAKD